MTDPASNRRDFLTGRSLGGEIRHVVGAASDALLDGLETPRTPPTSGPTVRLGTKAMACDFHVILNDGPDRAVETWHASDALSLIHELESQMTVYRDHSELLSINRQAADHSVKVEERLFDLLVRAKAIALETTGAYDPTSMPLVRMWKHCRTENRIPTQDEIDVARQQIGIEFVSLNPAKCEVSFEKPDIELQLNAIGKGYALDRAAEVLNEHNIQNWLLHGGHSSVLARGDHNGLGGWPVGLRNPIFPEERLGTLVLRNAAMGTSGNSVQFFRYQGQRYGHILDPRSGWPADKLLAATVIAPTAAEADALSTAFFVMGLENARSFCQNRPEIQALLIPLPRSGRTLEPVNCGIPDADLFFTDVARVN